MNSTEKGRRWREANRQHYRDYQKEYQRKRRAKIKAEQQEKKRIESTEQLEKGLNKYVKDYEDLESKPR